MASADIKESQISAKGKRKTTGKSTAEMSRKQVTDSGDATGGADAVEFNLSDPEQLARQLDRVDLTEEESDELLREAYKINKHLKMMLQQKQDKMAASMRSHSASSSTSSRRGGSILPPISSRSGGAPQRTVKAYGHSSSKTAAGASAASKSKTGKTRSPTHKPQPQWDDRFSFS